MTSGDGDSIQGAAASAVLEAASEFDSFLRYAPDYAYVTDDEGRLVYVNDRLEALWGDERTLLGKRETDLWPPELAAELARAEQQVRETGEPADTLAETTISGEPRRFEIYKFPIVREGRPLRIGTVCRDVTRLALCQKNATEIETRFRLFMKHFPGAAFIRDEQGRYVYANEYLAEQMGADEPAVDRPAPLFRPLGTPGSVEADEDAVRASGIPIQRVEQLPLKGGLRTFLTVRFPIPREGLPPLVGTISRDITDYAQAEQGRKEADERFRLFAEHFPGMVALKDEIGRFLYANDYVEQQLGQAAVGRRAGDLLPAELAEQSEADDEQVRTSGQPAHRVQVVPTVNGPRHFLVFKFPVPRDGMPPLVGVISRDITELIETEEKVAEYEKRLQALGENLSLADQAQRRAAELEIVIGSIADAVAIYDADGRIVRHNQAFVELTKHEDEDTWVPPAEHPPALSFRDGAGQPLPLDQSPPARAMRGETVSGATLVFENMAGEERAVVASAAPLRDGAGDVTGAVAVFTDVTQEHQAQERTERLVLELDAILSSIADAVLVYDRDGKVLRHNEAARSLLRYTPDMLEMTPAQRYEVALPVSESGEPVRTEDMPLMRALSGQQVTGFVMRFQWLGEEAPWLQASAAPFRSSAGEIAGAVQVYADITSLRCAEDELRTQRDRSKELAGELQTIMNYAPDGIVFYDTAGNILRINQAARDILGHPDEVIRLPLAERYRAYDVVDEEGQPITDTAGVTAAALHGETVHVASANLRSTPRGPVWISISAAPTWSPEGAVNGVVSVFSDITALHQAQQELRAHRDHLEQLVTERTAQLEANQQRLRALAAELSIAEQRERQRLATALHAEVAQTLGAIKLHLGMLGAVTTTPPIAEQVGAIVGLVEEAVRQSRSIMVELSPPVLQQNGLLEALRWWAEQVREKQGLEVSVTITGAFERPGTDVETTAFQTVRELLQNTVKYAQATSASISVNCENDLLNIEVADNGVGFDPASVEATEHGGFGLFSIRERIGYLGGEFVISSAPGQGTRARISLPGACQAQASNQGLPSGVGESGA